MRKRDKRREDEDGGEVEGVVVATDRPAIFPGFVAEGMIPLVDIGCPGIRMRRVDVRRRW